MAARSIPLKKGDEILTTDHEYGAMNRMWEFVCRRKGSHYIRQPLPLPVESTDQVVETIWGGVTERTRVLFISHITSPTALIFPVKELAKRAREEGIIIMVDGAHVPGQLPLSLDLLDVDFYAGNFHKWLMAPKGSAFLYAHPDMQSLLDPLVVSWGDKSFGSSSFIQENEYQGTRDIAAYLATPAAINFAQRYNWPDVRRKCHKLVVHARRKLAEITGLPPISPESDEWFSQMASHPLPECDGELLKKRLYDEFSIEIPIFEHNGKWFIRISVQGYNTLEDVGIFINAFSGLLKD